MLIRILGKAGWGMGWGLGKDVCTFFLVQQCISFTNACQGVGGRVVPIDFNYHNSSPMFILTADDFHFISFEFVLCFIWGFCHYLWA